jgi:hypothetical protein
MVASKNLFLDISMMAITKEPSALHMQNVVHSCIVNMPKNVA